MTYQNQIRSLHAKHALRSTLAKSNAHSFFFASRKRSTPRLLSYTLMSSRCIQLKMKKTATTFAQGQHWTSVSQNSSPLAKLYTYRRWTTALGTERQSRWLKISKRIGNAKKWVKHERLSWALDTVQSSHTKIYTVLGWKAQTSSQKSTSRTTKDMRTRRAYDSRGSPARSETTVPRTIKLCGNSTAKGVASQKFKRTLLYTLRALWRHRNAESVF